MDDELHARIADMAMALDEYEADAVATWQLAELYNALLAETQRTVPADPIIGAMEPVGHAEEEGFAASDCGSLRAAVRQLENALIAR